MPGKDSVRRKMAQKQHQVLRTSELQEEQLATREGQAHSGAEHSRPDPHSLTHGNVMQLQRVIGNQAVMRYLAQSKIQRQGGSPVTLHAPTKIQRVWENTVAHATKMRDAGKIKIFEDRIQHIIDRHGKTTGECSKAFYKFSTDDAATIKGYVEGALRVATPTLGVGDAYDFEASFTAAIGVNSDGDTCKRMRVVVVQTGKFGDLGKVQTAYPIK